MLDRLLESQARRDRSPAGAAASLTAHVAVILIAVHATAQSRPRPASVATVVLVPFVTKSDPAPPARTQPAMRSATPRRSSRNLISVSIDPKLPVIDFTPPSPTSPTDFSGGVSAAASNLQRIAGSQAAAFRADQVERQVSVLPGGPLPRYPEPLRSAGIEGKVVAQFTVDEAGVVDSVRFVRGDNTLFEESVRTVLRRMRFAPAEIGGRKVRQSVEMPFVFTISSRQ